MPLTPYSGLTIVRIPSYSRLDRSGNSRVGAPVSHRQPRVRFVQFSSHVSLPPFIDSRLSLIASSTTGARYPRTNHTLSRLSFSLFAYSLLLCTSGNDDQHSAVVARH